MLNHCGQYLVRRQSGKIPAYKRLMTIIFVNLFLLPVIIVPSLKKRPAKFSCTVFNQYSVLINLTGHLGRTLRTDQAIM